MVKKICVVTGTRAEYGLLSGIMARIQQEPTLQLQVIACAAHLSEKYGMTVNQILADGFQVDQRVEMLEDSAEDDQLEVVESVARGVSGFGHAYQALKPDVVLVLGDRYEILAAAQAALLMNIPIAHIHGGEVTEGAVDEAIRHAITKMASLHFTAAESYRKRVIQMGERPETVFNVGAPGLDVIRKLDFLSKEALEADLNLSLDSPVFLVTYHPVTWGNTQGVQALENLCLALEHFEEATVIWTGANADAEGRYLNDFIQNWVKLTPLKVHFATSLGSLRYLSLMKLADAVVGNSSSGIIEAPAVGVPTVNIGTRQKGRLRSPSVIDCDESAYSIEQALRKALSLEQKQIADKKISVYGKGESAKLICDRLVHFSASHLAGKPFYDLPVIPPLSD